MASHIVSLKPVFESSLISMVEVYGREEHCIAFRLKFWCVAIKCHLIDEWMRIYKQCQETHVHLPLVMYVIQI